MTCVCVCAVAGLACYTTEAFPTHVRATGSGIGSACARLAGIVTPIAAGALLDIWPTSLLLITGVSGLVAAVCSGLLPFETRGRSVA